MPWETNKNCIDSHTQASKVHHHCPLSIISFQPVSPPSRPQEVRPCVRCACTFGNFKRTCVFNKKSIENTCATGAQTHSCCYLLASLSFHTRSDNSNNNGQPLALLLKTIRNQRYRGLLSRLWDPTWVHQRGHQKCPRQHKATAAKLLISLETGVCLGPSVGTIAIPGAPYFQTNLLKFLRV